MVNILVLVKSRLQELGGDLLFDKIVNDGAHGNLLDAIDDDKLTDFADQRNQHEKKVLDQFVDAAIAVNPAERFKNLQEKYPIAEQNRYNNDTNIDSSNEQFAAIQQQLEQRQAEFQKLSERFSQLESQLRQSETEKERLSQELAQKQEQEKIRQAEEAKQKVEPQKPVEIKPNAEIETNEIIDNDNVISSEVSEMTSLLMDLLLHFRNLLLH